MNEIDRTLRASPRCRGAPVQANGRPPVTGLDGRRAVEIGLAAGRSLAENRPVRVAEIGG